MATEGATSSGSSSSNQSVKIKHGAWQKDMPSGMTVKEYRQRMSTFANVPADAVAMSGTKQLNEDDIVEPGGSLEFMKKTGEKG